MTAGKRSERINSAHKTCSKCASAMPATPVFFGRDKKTYDGLRAECKACARIVRKAHYEKTKKQQIAAVSEWRKKNPDRHKLREKARRLRNKFIAERVDAAKARAKRYKAKKQSSDASWKLTNLVRCRMHKSLRGKSPTGWREVVGYSIEDLRAHLERQFKRGMTWSNLGDWHIDHIVPIAHFKYTSVNDADFKAAWALTNLRPLWAVENLAKKDVRTHLL
jgi:hypothetical protein